MRTIFYIYILIGVVAGAKGQQLQLFIEEAQQNNPKIQAFELRYSIAQEKIDEASALPNTSITAGYFVQEVKTRTGDQRARFSVSQMLPWFGTLSARENYAKALAETEYIEILIVKRKLALAVAQSYYTLMTLKSREKILLENIELLKTYEQLAFKHIEVGKASAVDVLRLQMRQNELHKEYKVLQEDFAAQAVAFNTLLNRKKTLPISLEADVTIPKTDFEYTESEIQLNPELIKYEKLFASITQSELVNQRERAPSIGVGLDYIAVDERKDVIVDDSGNDIVMPMVTVSIPIFNSKYQSITKQNELRQQEIEAQKQERLNTLRDAFAKAKHTRNTARIEYETQEKNLSQARDAEEILLKSYETGTIDFNDVLDIQELQLQFQKQKIEAIQTYYTQSAIMNYLINK